MKAAARLQRLQEKMAHEGLDALIIRKVPDLMWLTGFEYVFDGEEAHTALITQDSCMLHTDTRYSSALRAAAQDEGIWLIDDEALRLSEWLEKAAKAQGLEQAVIAIDKMTPLALYRAFSTRLPQVEFAERDSDTTALRAIKDACELDCIKRAQHIAEKAFRETLACLKPGQTEREVSLELEFAMRRSGADCLSFPNIVASGPNSANPHAIPGERALQPGDLIVFDFGACVNGYCSDTTRTVCLGEPTEEQRRIYTAVQEANEAVEARLRPGVCCAEMHQLAEDVLESHGFKDKMGHGLGHGVGLEVHELPVLSPRVKAKLEPGNVVTVEPGVYLSGSNGVRLEDFGCITDDSFDNFCTLPHEMMVVW